VFEDRGHERRTKTSGKENTPHPLSIQNVMLRMASDSTDGTEEGHN